MLRNPAGSNEYYELDLPMTWEPLDSSGPERNGKPDMNVSIRLLNWWYIDALVDSRGEIGVWRFTGFYGNPKTQGRVES